MTKRTVKGLLFAGGVSCLLMASGAADPALARQVGWCSSNGGAVQRVSGFVNGVIYRWGSGNMVSFDGGRNSAQDCWDVAVSWLSNNMSSGTGDQPAAMCAENPFLYSVGSQFSSGVSFNGTLLGYPIGTYYCN